MIKRLSLFSLPLLLISCNSGGSSTPPTNTQYLPSGTYNLTSNTPSGQEGCGAGVNTSAIVSNGKGQFYYATMPNIQINLNFNQDPCVNYNSTNGDIKANITYSNCKYNSSTNSMTGSQQSVFIFSDKTYTCKASVTILPLG